jgi:putative flavoprotein involved in K+ transport
VHASRRGLQLPPADARTDTLHDPREVVDPIRTLDLAAAGISTVLWASGFRYDFDWIDLPIFAKASSSDRVPAHRRGVTAVPGVYFIGLSWLHKLNSAFLHGVGDDARYLAECITGHSQARPA